MRVPVIRRAARADVPSRGRRGTLLVQAHHDFDRERFIAPGPSTPEHYGAFLGTQIDDPDAIVLVAELDGIIGYAFAVVEGYDYMALRGPAGVLHDLIVDPGHRGGGVGRQLLHAVMSELASRHVPRVVLTTAERNSPAHRLFERLGFRPTMVEMTCELDSSAPSRG